MVLSIGILLTGCGCNNNKDYDNEIPVVNNNNTTNVHNLSNDYEDLYNESVKSVVKIQAGTQLGSGVVYKEENGTYYLVTNNHVIKVVMGGEEFCVKYVQNTPS